MRDTGTVLRVTVKTALWVVAAPAGFVASLANRGRVAPELFTIGYERYRTPHALADALHGAGVERLVDVRELPLSRRKGFSKTALADVLADAGVAYEHDRALGNPKPYRDLYKSGHRAEGERRYRRHVRNGSAGAVDELADSLGGARTAVMCVEHDHRECHRAVLVDELRRRLPALRVTHL